MEEKEPQFTVIDRRKFTSEGEIRPEAANEKAEEVPQTATSAPAPEAIVSSGIHALPPASATAASQPSTEPDPAEMETLQGPTAEESAESLAAYSETT
ncbi:MAG TPA: hypothetical protein VMU62_07490, partial [Acidobacteriaceae bacterium]|nr:hypothetical protein [Acidobacteriaceae bacterium]